MANNQKEKNLYTGDPRAEKKFHIGMYYKVTGGYTLVVAILYAVQRALNSKGYIMINSTLPYWLWYALVIGILLVVGRLIANLPKNNVTRRAVKVCVAIVSIFTLFAMYLQCISRIDTECNQYAVVDSPDGKREVVIMRANLTISKAAQEGEDAQDKQYTLYKAYPKLNAVFCDGRDNTDMIWLVNDPDAKLNYEWSDNGLRLYTEGNAMETTEADGTTHLLNEIDLTF